MNSISSTRDSVLPMEQCDNIIAPPYPAINSWARSGTSIRSVREHICNAEHVIVDFKESSETRLLRDRFSQVQSYVGALSFGHSPMGNTFRAMQSDVNESKVRNVMRSGRRDYCRMVDFRLSEVDFSHLRIVTGAVRNQSACGWR